MENDRDLEPKKPENNDIGSWILIAVMFAVAWPIGLILLISKLSDGSRRERIRRSGQETFQAARKTVSAAQARPRPQSTQESVGSKLTRTPQFSDKGAKTMRIVGIVLALAGAYSLITALSGDVSGLLHGDWEFILGELFYPTGMVAGGLGLLLGGRSMQRRAQRFGKYLAIAGQKECIPLNQLALAADVSTHRVEKDLEMMIQRGLWGESAYLDVSRGLLVRSAAAAEDYMQRQTASAAPPQAEQGYSGQLRDIRRANDRIADPAISAKIDRLEDLAGKIFRMVEQEPTKKAKAATFLNYYLPTTQKLLDSYADFEESGISGENVTQAKERIAGTLDKIVEGFERQLDQLYQADAMDIDSDIRVMEQMLRRDGSSAAEDFGTAAAEDHFSE